MKLQIFLSIVYLSLGIDSQSLKPTRTYNGYQPGSGQLFFEDNLPRNVNINNSNLSNNDEQNTQQVPTQPDNDSYLRAHRQMQQNTRNGGKPANQINNLQNQNVNQYNYLNRQISQPQNQFNPISNPNSNYQFQQSLEISPPSQTSQDYYTAQPLLKQSENGVDDRYQIKGAAVAPSPTPLFNATKETRLVSAVISHIGLFIMKSQQSSRNQSNVVVSPMSVVNMLALLQAGASGATQEQVSNALRLKPETSATAFQLINAHFRKRGNQRNVLRLATSIFAADSFDLSGNFKSFAIQNFGSEISKTSFGDPNAAAQKINSWISSKTNDKIDNLVSPDSIGVNTQLVLANAVYFKGLWETMFKPQATSVQDFYMSNGNKQSVPFMMLRSGFKAGLDKANNALVVVLPFENNEYSLVMLLPTAGADVATVLATLNGDSLADYQNYRRQDVFLQIPKFTVRGNTDLQPVLAKMGITKMFTPTSELSNIGLYRSNSPQISSAVHSAMMSIDEQGATAAASTVVAVVALSYDNPSVVFKADRPFLAVLWDNQLNLPLFMTKIEDPSLQ